jgi:hypothetical protein
MRLKLIQNLKNYQEDNSTNNKTRDIMKTYLLRGLLLLTVVYGLFYWFDQQAITKPETQVNTEALSTINNKLESNAAAFVIEKSVKAPAVLPTAVASHATLENPFGQTANSDASGFVPDPQGKLTNKQISQYVNILELVLARLGPESAASAKKSDTLQKQFQMQVKSNMLSLDSYLVMYAQNLLNDEEIIDKSRKIQTEILIDKKMPQAEYRWIAGSVFQALMLLGGTELKANSLKASALKLEEIEKLSFEDYSPFVQDSYFTELGISKESISKEVLALTPEQRFAKLKASMRAEQIRTMKELEESDLFKPVDNEQNRANAESLRPYKSLLLRAQAQRWLHVM